MHNILKVILLGGFFMKKHQYLYDDQNFELLYVQDYYPCRNPETGEINNDFYDHNCGILLNFKQNKGDSLDHVRGYLYNDPDWDRLTHELKDEDVHVYTFPSCTVDNFNSGLYALVDDICRANEGFFDASRCLLRTKPVAPTEDKQVTSHLATISKTSCVDITNESIAIIFDDVTTTGASLKAGHDILKKEGYKTIICIAIAKTMIPGEEGKPFIK